MNLDKIRDFLPDFQIESFSIFEKVTSLKWETVFDCERLENSKNLFLEMTSPEGYKIRLEFKGVNYLYFDGRGQISGFCITDMADSGYEEASRYRISDFENDEIKFYCRDVIVNGFEKL